MKKLTKEQRAARVDRAIILAWGSLYSHLGFTQKSGPVRKEGAVFHQKCVREYSELIKILSELY
jgi:hypothetical protein